MFFPSQGVAGEAAAGYRVTTAWEDVPVDLETPISIFKKTATGEFTYLLESVEGGERLARYSFIGFDPLLIYRARGNTIEIQDGERQRVLQGDPLGGLKDLMSGLQVGPLPEGVRFCGGAVGYFSYDLVRSLEQLPEKTVDDLQLPDCCFLITRNVLIYDHVGHTLKIVAFVPEQGDPAEARREAAASIARVKDLLRRELPREQTTAGQRPPEPLVSNLSREDFLAGVCRAREYIRDGEIFQVVLSQRLQQRLQVDPLAVYRVLRSLNPSPYMYYLNFGDTRVIGSSPEMLVRVEDGWVETHPIAGTRPRGAVPEEDDALARELQGDPKERAEHVMLVDLGRNDLGRVCQYGTVRLTRFMENERYSHVMHLVSVVRGKLARGRDAFDALRACFPAGTVSGAPKVRAMEIIEELEPTRRGPYAGAIGYLSFNGNLDSCIAIRTMVVRNGTAYVQAGAGIVADSVPEREYQETLNKAMALLKALRLAEGGRVE